MRNTQNRDFAFFLVHSIPQLCLAVGLQNSEIWSRRSLLLKFTHKADLAKSIPTFIHFKKSRPCVARTSWRATAWAAGCRCLLVVFDFSRHFPDIFQENAQLVGKWGIFTGHARFLRLDRAFSSDRAFSRKCPELIHQSDTHNFRHFTKYCRNSKTQLCRNFDFQEVVFCLDHLRFKVVLANLS